MTVFSNWLTMLRDDDGQGLAEYALILALIAIIAIAALIFLGGEIAAILSSIGAQIYGRFQQRAHQATPAFRRRRFFVSARPIGAFATLPGRHRRDQARSLKWRQSERSRAGISSRSRLTSGR